MLPVQGISGPRIPYAMQCDQKTKDNGTRLSISDWSWEDLCDIEKIVDEKGCLRQTVDSASWKAQSEDRPWFSIPVIWGHSSVLNIKVSQQELSLTHPKNQWPQTCYYSEPPNCFLFLPFQFKTHPELWRNKNGLDCLLRGAPLTPTAGSTSVTLISFL